MQPRLHGFSFLQEDVSREMGLIACGKIINVSVLQK